MIRSYRSGFTLTDGDGHEVVHVLPCRLWIPGGGYGSVETTLRTVALDQQTIQVETFTGGAEELRGRLRYHGYADALLALLREGARGRVLTYYPDLSVPGEAYPCVLMDYGTPVQLASDGARSAYGEWEAAVTLRRVDGGSLAPLATGELFSFRAGGPLHRATFTRATPGTRIGPGRQLETIASGKRRVTWIQRDEVWRPYTLCEQGRTQLVSEPEDFSAWTDGGVDATGGHLDPFGGTDAFLLDSTGPSASDARSLTVAFTGDGTKAPALFVRQGSGPVFGFAIWDNTAGVYRHLVHGTWTAGVPVLTTQDGSGVRFPVEGPLFGGWWRIALNGAGVVAANTNRLFVYPDRSGAGGTLYVFGANAWNATYPLSYQGPSLDDRNADQLFLEYPFGPVAASYALRFVELAQPNWVGGGSSPRLFSISDNLGNAPALFGLKSDATPVYVISHDNGVQASVASTVDLDPDAGDEIELLGEVRGDGAVRLRGRKNGGALVDGGWSAGHPFAAAWSAQELHVGIVGASAPGDIAVDQLVGRRGSGHDFDRLFARLARFGG